MPRKTGIILAYDRSTFTDEEEELLYSLSPYVDLVKVGLEAMTEAGDDGYSIADHVSAFSVEMKKRSMWDCKFHDIGNTVEKAILNITGSRPSIKMLTVHAAMSDKALRAAAKACAEANVLLLAVTVLTDIDQEQCFRLFQRTPAHAVLDLVTKATEAGVRGIVCSPKEIELIRDGFGSEVTLVVPGIRPLWAPNDDQKRVMTPSDAAKAGADYVVIGRPILQPPVGMTSVEAARRIYEELGTAHKTGTVVAKIV